MTTTEILTKIPDWVELIAIFLMALTVIATILARVTPTKADDEYVSKFHKLLMKAIAFAPTIGMNPRTKQLEETIKILQTKVEASDAKPETKIS